MRYVCALAVLLAGACARPTPRDEPAAPALSPAAVASMDAATVRRLCVAPDRVLAGRRPCVLRDQRLPLRVF